MARMGGLFPFPQANVNEGGSRIDLPSGGVFVLPGNQYLILTDASTIVQWWDPLLTSWQTLFGNSAGGDVTSDGCNYRLFNNTGTISAGVIANGTAAGLTNGIGPATGVTAAISAAPAGGVTGTAYVIVGGAVAAPTVTQAGSGFTGAPLIVIDNPGAGYIASPNFWIIPQNQIYAGGPSGAGQFAAAPFLPPGLVFPSNAVAGNQNIGPAGAQLTSVALTSSGLITGFVRVNFGAGYTGTPTVALANSGTGSLGTAAITLSAVVAAAIGTALVAPRIAS